MTTNEIAITSALTSSGVLSALITVGLNWRINQRLEKLKSSLDKGLYVSKAHYDLELEPFKKLWAVLSDLWLKVRAFRGPEKFQLFTPDGLDVEWFSKSLEGVVKGFFAAHNNAVQVDWSASPFYPEAIKKAAEKTFDIDLTIIQQLGRNETALLTLEWLEELKAHSIAMDHQVNEVEMLIRSRLETLRIISQ